MFREFRGFHRRFQLELFFKAVAGVEWKVFSTIRTRGAVPLPAPHFLVTFTCLGQFTPAFVARDLREALSRAAAARSAPECGNCAKKINCRSRVTGAWSSNSA